MVGLRFQRNLSFIKALLKEKNDKERLKMINKANDEEIFSLMDAAYNILKFKFPLKPKQRRKLALHAKLLRKLAKKKTADSGRKMIQKGKGAMLTALLVPIVTEVASRLISHFKK